MVPNIHIWPTRFFKKVSSDFLGMPAALPRKVGLCCIALLGTTVLSARATEAQSLQNLEQLSLEDLSKIEITSVSKTAEPVSDAPAAIYVITRDEIIRSGATRIPEMLRLAPNLQVAQTSANDYVITARGFSGNVANQNLPNKLLVLIDGRSVYTPLYSGVYWDMQDVLPADIERIEVISGSGATLWGANAVNGVINIITRTSSDTQGGLVEVGTGNLTKGAGLRYGGILGNTTYRVYAKAFDDEALEAPTGSSAQDGWSKVQTGFRIDAKPGGEALTVQGDVYHNTQGKLNAPDDLIAGGNLLARWQHQFNSGSAVQVQAYFDQTQRFSDDDLAAGFVFKTYDLSIQHSFTLGSGNDIVWGAGERVNRYRITNTDAFLFDPASRTFTLANVFGQDSISLSKTVKLILGTKLEDDPYTSALTPLPSARLSWKVSDATLLWTAVSRAVRSPTPFDRDLVENLGPIRFLKGDPNYQSEKLTAYELGYRGQPSANSSLSISTYYNVYDDLRSVELAPGGTILPLQWGNGMKGDTYGVEIWGSYQVSPDWRLDAGFNAMHEDLRFKNNSAGSLGLSGFPGLEQAGSDPSHQASLRSSMNLAAAITLDLDLRYVGARPDPVVPSYHELNAHLAWSVSRSWVLSLSGFNLLHAQHQEYTEPSSDSIKRSVFVNSRWSF